MTATDKQPDPGLSCTRCGEPITEPGWHEVMPTEAPEDPLEPLRQLHQGEFHPACCPWPECIEGGDKQ